METGSEITRKALDQPRHLVHSQRMATIPFNKPFLSGKEDVYLKEMLTKTLKFSGDGPFTKQVSGLLEKKLNAKKVLLTTSCTHAIEMAAILCDVKPGDEVIVPSFTFVSSANPFVLRGAKIIWADVDVQTMNMSLESFRECISSKTKAVVLVHYAGMSSPMDEILALAEQHHFFVVEDAAQAIGSTYRGKALGTFGDLGCLSFHETKNLHCGEGGALIINNEKMMERAEIIREKGTNRAKFFRGEVDKYSWVDVGSSYLPSELNAAFLLAQIEEEEKVTLHRVQLWNRYHERLKQIGKIKIPVIPPHNRINGHIFYLLTESDSINAELIEFLKKEGVHSTFHYVPLHSAPLGLSAGEERVSLKNTENYAMRLVRLPLYYDLSLDEADFVAGLVRKFYGLAS